MINTGDKRSRPKVGRDFHATGVTIWISQEFSITEGYREGYRYRL